MAFENDFQLVVLVWTGKEKRQSRVSEEIPGVHIKSEHDFFFFPWGGVSILSCGELEFIWIPNLVPSICCCVTQGKLPNLSVSQPSRICKMGLS